MKMIFNINVFDNIYSPMKGSLILKKEAFIYKYD